LFFEGNSADRPCSEAIFNRNWATVMQFAVLTIRAHIKLTHILMLH
jgi:hypothetical protein